MKRLFALLAVGACLAFGATAASAAQYPPGPGGTCTDTLSIVELQTQPPLACSPAAGDTVYGVRGVITGFDKDFSPYAFWIQLNTPGQWRGIQVFTGGTNYYNPVAGTPTGGDLKIGDEVVVYGRVLEFNGMTEFLDFDNNQTSNDIIVRQDDTTNVAVPDYYVGDVDQFNWVTGLATNAEPYEGMLVKIRGPLVVGRTVGTGVGSRSMLLAHASFPGDTACVDGFSLTNLAALPVGTVIDSVQGIMTQVVISGVPSYRILMRGAEDRFVAAPPNVTDAYPVEDNLIRITFDLDLDEASAEDVANYSLVSSGTINSATLLGGSGKVVILDVTNGLTDGDPETVTITGVKSSSGVAMPAAQNRSFANGVMRLSRVNYPSSVGLGEAPCSDRTEFSNTNGTAGTRVSYRGVCVAGFATLYFLADEGATPDSLRSAMPVFGPFQSLTVGNKYLIAGQVSEFNGISTSAPAGLTEGVNSVFIQDEGPATLPTPSVQTIATLSDSTCDVTQSVLNGEDFEGMLVRLEYVRIAEERTPGQSFFVADLVTPDTMLISNRNNAYTFDPDSAHTVTVTGVLDYRTGSRAFRVVPRNDADIIDHGLNVGVGAGEQKQLRFAIFPNPSKSPQLAFTLPTAGNVEIAAYDVSGRKVADVFSGYLPAGQYARSWNGTTKSGRLGAGLYFLRLRTGGKEMVARSVLLQ